MIGVIIIHYNRLSFKRNRGKLFKKIFITYIIILIIPLLLFALFFQLNVVNFFKTESNNTNMNNLSILEKDVDKIIEKLKSNVLQIALNNDVQELFKYKDVMENNDYYYIEKVIDVANLLNSYIVANDDIHTIYLFNNKTNKIITPWGEIYNKENFYDTEWTKAYNMNKEQIKILPKRKIVEENLDYFYYIDIDRDIVSTVVTMIYPLELLNTFDFEGALVININKEVFDFSSINESDTYNNDFFYILNSDGTIIVNGKNQDKQISRPLINSIIESQEAKGYLIRDIHHKKYLVSYSKSRDTGLIYVNAISLNSLYKQVNCFNIWLIVLSVIILIFGVIFAYYISKKIYNPINDILENLKFKIDKNKAKKNELYVISDVVSNILEEDQKLINLFEMNEKAIRQSYIMQLVRGNCEKINEIFNSRVNMYCTLVISIDRYNSFSKKYLYKEQYYFKTLLLKTAEQVTANNNEGIIGAGSLLNQDKVVIILGLIKEGFVDSMNHITEEIIKQTSIIEDFTISIGVGNIYKRKERIRLSYLEAIEALNYRIIAGYNSIIYYEELKDNDRADFDFVTREKHIMNYLKKNSYEDIELTLIDIISEIKNKKNVSYESIVPIFYSLLSRTIEYLLEANISITEVFEESYNIFRELSEKDTVEDIREFLLYIYKNIIEYQENNSVKDSKNIKQVVELISDNYSDSNLDLNWLVDKLDISYSHLRKIIKENLGITFINYLNNIRITKAKELLIETDDTVKDIAIEVGYNNTQSFTRYFKKYEGITPGEYRDIREG
ncbi:helix-turn-helix domain-containing protein [Vallitalea guaymasensis]|uniref:helix-turn-helix domain-containing protein n=1 Tax=Vallitalea guaymasensis TaxID=1185412 RepID=UPI00272D380F|nr:helix-turn-helix domain-containing protein [Vallitalea guaymasensis]